MFYAARANSLSSRSESGLQYCKSLLILAEIEQALGHLHTSLDIICRNLPSMCRVEDPVIYGRAMLILSSCLVDLYAPRTECNERSVDSVGRQILEVTQTLLKESISSFAKVWNVKFLIKSMAVYQEVLCVLDHREKSEKLVENIVSLHNFCKARRRLSYRNISEIMNIIYRLYLSKKGDPKREDDSDCGVKLLLGKLGATELARLCSVEV